MTIKRRLSISFLLLAMAVAARAQDTNFAVRVPCEMQATAGESEPRLASLTWLQGTTPLVVAEPLRRGRAIPYDTDTRVRMVIGPSATGALYAVRTNAAAVTNGYAVQWPTIGTNTAGAAWFYTILFDKDGRTYWTGSGELYIERAEWTGTNGIEWIEYVVPSVGWENVVGDDASVNAALTNYVGGYVAEHGSGSGEDSILAVGAVASNAYAAATNAQQVASAALPASATNALLDLAGTRAMTGDVVTLARDVKSRDAASVGEYGAAFGEGTTAGYAGAAFGAGTTAGHYGAAFGEGTTAGNYGAAFGENTTAGKLGFSAGRYAHGTTGSFVFADSASDVFDRTNSPNSFSVRAAGGTYFDTPLFTVTGEVAAARIALGTNAAVSNWPQGTILGATINEPHAVATNDGILAFTVTADGSGFPLTNDVSAAGYNVEQVGLLSASSVRAATDVYATNDVSARDLYSRRNLDVAGNGTIDGDLVVSGNFTLIGSATNLIYTTYDYRTNVYGGTNYIDTTVYSTQIIYSTIYVYTNIVTTNTVNTYVNEGGSFTMGAGSTFDAEGAASVLFGPGGFSIGGTSFAAAVSAEVSSKADASTVAPLYLGSWPPVEIAVTAANSTVSLSTSNKAYRVHCSGSGTITNWTMYGVSTAALDWCAVVLEPGAATDFSWQGLRTNVPLPAAYSTNVYFPWRGPGSGYWTVD
jgi:hypothetical protein